jgi:hypothetical protein
MRTSRLFVALALLLGSLAAPAVARAAHDGT